MKNIIKQISNSKPAIFLLYIIVRLYLLTIRVTIVNENEWIRHVKKGKTVLICMFHQQFFPGIRFFARYLKHNPCILISESRDGQIVAWAAQFFGATVIRGSSSSGGRRAKTEMVDFLKEKKGFCINMVDGPRGPVGIVKPGSIRICQQSGASIFPAYFQGSRVWQFNSWDGFIIPKPFSRVKMIFGEKMDIKQELTSVEFENKRLELQQVMAPYLQLNS